MRHTSINSVGNIKINMLGFNISELGKAGLSCYIMFKGKLTTIKIFRLEIYSIRRVSTTQSTSPA